MKKLVITDKPMEIEEHLSFWIDEKARTLILPDGRQLRITRLDKYWISAKDDDVQYEFNRSDGTLSFAGTTSQGSATTTVLGSGHCESADKT